jgi:hypothetical protein
MKLVDPQDPDLSRVMDATAELVRIRTPLPMTTAGRAEMLAIIEYQHRELCPTRRFVFAVERFPGTNWANVSVHELEPGDLH